SLRPGITGLGSGPGSNLDPGPRAVLTQIKSLDRSPLALLALFRTCRKPFTGRHRTAERLRGSQSTFPGLSALPPNGHPPRAKRILKKNPESAGPFSVGR